MNNSKGGLLELEGLGTYRVDEDKNLFVIKEKFKALSEVDVFYLNLLRTIDFGSYEVADGNYSFESLSYTLLDFRRKTLKGEEIHSIYTLGENSSLISGVEFVFKPYPILGNLIRVHTPVNISPNMEIEAYKKIVGKEFIDYDPNIYIDSFEGDQILNNWAENINAMLK